MRSGVGAFCEGSLCVRRFFVFFLEDVDEEEEAPEDAEEELEAD